MLIFAVIVLLGLTVVQSSRENPIGIDPQGTEAYYSQSSLQSKPNYSRGVYTGQKYECVEYVRRWWIKNKAVTFEQIDSAIELAHLSRAKSIHKYNQFFPVRSALQERPEVGDLVIFKPTPENNYYGHIAVVVRVEQDAAHLAEQNYSNEKWKEDYSRSIPIVNDTLQDSEIIEIRRLVK
jgi:glutathionylspermidine amidase/synthetase